MAGDIDSDWPEKPLGDEKREEMLTLMAAGRRVSIVISRPIAAPSRALKAMGAHTGAQR